MPYYRAGDYYAAGDYYRAGGIFSTLGNIAKGALGVVSRAGIPIVSAAASGVTSVIDSITSHSSAPSTSVNVSRTVAPQFSMAGPIPTVSTASGPGPRHPIRQAGHALLPGLIHGVRHRHMRVTNEKALKRAERRLKGFEKIAKRALRPLGLHVVRHQCSHGSPFKRKRR